MRMFISATGAVLLSASAMGAVIDSSWIGRNLGNWSVSTNWSPTGVPNDGANQYHVFITPRNPVTVNMDVTVGVQSITLASDNILNVLNAQAPVINGGVVNNDGTIQLLTTGNNTDLRLNSDTTMSGSGQFVFGGGPARLYGINATRRLTNAGGHAIRGVGQLGLNNALALTNSSLIEADVSGGVLDVNMVGSDNFNTGTFRAVDGGILAVADTVLNSTGGLFVAEPGSEVHFNGSTITGGTIDTNGSGVARATGTSTFNSITNTGLLVTNNAVAPVWTGTIVNNGTLALNGGGNNTDFRLNSDVLLDGAGELDMTSSVNNRIYGINANRRLTNGPSHLIHGMGQFGVNNALFLTNNGVIEADVPGGALNLNLVGGAASNINNATLRATSGGILAIADTALTNVGQIVAETGSEVHYSGSHIIGGSLDVSGSGVHRITGSSTFESLENTGLLQLNNATTLDLVGTMVNNGVWRVDAAANQTDLRLNSAVVTFTGGGEIELSASVNNRIYGINANRRLVNAADHLIHGAGQLGVNSAFFLTNEGLIQADHAGLELNINVVGGLGDNFNVNVIESVDGGVLTFGDTAINNTDGVIRAGAGSTTNITNTVLLNGLLESVDDGLLQVVGTSRFIDVTVAGELVVNNAVTAILESSLTMDGDVRLNAGGNLVDLQLDSAEVLMTGEGELRLSNSPNNRIYGVNANRRLVNDLGHVIAGSGQLGVNSALLLTNNGTIRADQPIGLAIDLVGAGDSNLNNGLIEAVNGATLQIAGTALNNTLGLILAGDTSFVDIAASSITGGVLDSSGSGQVRCTSPSTLTDLQNTGTFALLNASSMVLQGTIVNDGTIAVNAGGNLTDVLLNSSPVTLAGSGQLVMSNSVNNNRIYGINATRRLINGAGHAIRGSGSLGVNSAFDLTNQGLILADQTGGISIDASNDFTHEGVLHASGGNITIHPATFTTSGLVLIDAGRTLTRVGSYPQTAGVTQVDGALTVNSGSVALSGGTLGGSGQVNSAVGNTAGTVAPGSSAGQLTIAGTYNQSAAGAFAVEIGGYTPGAEHDRLVVTSTATLAGTLKVARINGFIPLAGDQFTVLTAATRLGQFDSVESCDPVTVAYTDTSVIVTFTSASGVPGDLNQDAVVDGADLGLLLGSWGDCPADSCCVADLNDDAEVDGADLGLLLGNWTI